jgi:uncharacterized RmlC-like cupin family protein
MEAATGPKLGRVVPAGESYRGQQGPNYTPGISAETVGSERLWLGSGLVTNSSIARSLAPEIIYTFRQESLTWQ